MSHSKDWSDMYSEVTYVCIAAIITCDDISVEDVPELEILIMNDGALILTSRRRTAYTSEMDIQRNKLLIRKWLGRDTEFIYAFHSEEESLN